MIKSPVLIIGCPRSGTTLLYNVLSEASELWSIGSESGSIIEQWHHPRNKNWESGVLTADDLTPQSRSAILDAFERQVAPGSYWRGVNRVRSWLRGNRLWKEFRRRGRSGQPGAMVSSALPNQGLAAVRTVVRLRNILFPPSRQTHIRLLEKTPENCLRLPFLLSLFPDAQIIHLVRDGRSNISSLMEGWKHPYLFHGYRPPVALSIDGNGQRDAWAFTLIPGWEELVHAPLEEVCAWQWIRCNEAVVAHRRNNQGQVPYLTIKYEQLVRSPGQTLRSIAKFTGIDFEQALVKYSRQLPQVNVVTDPDLEKWRQTNREAISRIWYLIEPLMEILGYETSGV